MFGKISKKKLAGVVLAGIITVTGATTAFAADQTSSSGIFNHFKSSSAGHTKMSATIKSSIDSLVTAGTITQAQAEAVLKAYTPSDKKGNPPEAGKSPMDELVTVGTITQAQADAINESMKSARESKKTMEDILKELVSAGTITQAQADAVSKSIVPRGGKFGNAIAGKSPFDKLVTAGTITQAQADAISESMKSARESKKSIEDVLKEMVTAGTINQTQSDAILKAHTPGDRKGNPPEARKSHLGELVTAGTITQAQADAINAAVKSAMDTLMKSSN